MLAYSALSDMLKVMDALWNIVAGLGGAIIGSIVTFYSNVRLEKIKVTNDKSSRANDLILAIRLSLSSSTTSLDSLKLSLEDKRIYLFRWTNILRSNIDDLKILRNEFHLLDNSELQEKLYILITDMSLFVGDLEAIETWQNGLNSTPSIGPNGAQATPEDKQQQEEHLKEQRSLKLVELVDLKRRIADVIRDLRREE